MISKYNENTIQIPHGTKPDTQDCGHAKKEEVRTMLNLSLKQECQSGVFKYESVNQGSFRLKSVYQGYFV